MVVGPAAVPQGAVPTGSGDHARHDSGGVVAPGYGEGVIDPRHPGLPPDPFAGDPDDPTAEMDELYPPEPLSDEERGAVLADLEELEEFQRILAPTGLRGVVVQCEDCSEDHFHDWDMLRANLHQLLRDGTLLPHEPAFDPHPDDYASWDYCRGYADAVRALRPWRPRWRG